MSGLLSRIPQTLSRGVILNGVILNGVTATSVTGTRTQPFSRTSVNQLKEIVHKEKEGVLTIEGVYIKSPREDYLIKTPPVENSKETHKKACPLCRIGPLAYQIKHTDVLILSQFVRPDGQMLPKRISGLCALQQRRMTWLVAMARGAGLMKNCAPRYGWKHFNKYYEEEIIEDFLIGRRMRA